MNEYLAISPSHRCHNIVLENVKEWNLNARSCSILPPWFRMGNYSTIRGSFAKSYKPQTLLAFSYTSYEDNCLKHNTSFQ